jgi:hypothetical protein
MNSTNRRGVAIVVGLVCLAMASVLMAVILRIVVIQRGAARDEVRRVQAALLVDSALERAGRRLAADPDYSGETWKITPDVLGGRHGAVVRIEVDASGEDSRQRLVRVVADYPDDPVDRVRKSKQLLVRLAPRETAPSGEQVN